MFLNISPQVTECTEDTVMEMYLDFLDIVSLGSISRGFGLGDHLITNRAAHRSPRT